MAYTLVKEGKVWHVRWTLDGKRTKRSTGEVERGRADRRAAAMYRDAALWARNGRTVPTLRELVAQWLVAHQHIASKSHLEGMERFGRLHLFGLAEMQIDELTTTAVEAARGEYVASHSASGSNHWYRLLRLVVRWAVNRSVIPAVPFRLKAIKIQRRARTTLPVGLTAAWLAAVDEHASEGVCIAVRLMIGLGLREAETFTAQWQWLDFVRATYTPARTKGKEAEPLPVPQWLLDYLRPLRKPSGLMAVRADGRAYGRQFTRKAIADANAAIGVMGVTAHRLRGSFATLMSESGAPVQSIQRALRHKDIRTTLGYLESDLHHIALAQERMATAWGFA
ncbi:phage integrase family protein [Caballeronia peredens]|nr:phage integrase family protein [Caballeronia peredens]